MLDIVIDIAHALDYLHNRCEQPIVQCDLKPSNVLLDSELTGHVSDLGLARFLSKLTSTASANQSSSGAEDQLVMLLQVSTNGDVYSLGILLLLVRNVYGE
ncbi:putative protein kinase RLK-Pelle-LRR-XII-1 family [Rosa chinensis]|uniref:Protein kinase domain-containing protein n=1 Tax=Rosa chinensis TaxID=74649 RepID=A0A2P6SHC9_ROSCH|nr:putative protein kinase RLK-Pelle-LRR-XII-1 family [Rosa chinensis]